MDAIAARPRATTATRSATCRGVGGRKGDVVVDIDGCAGRAPRADRLRGQELQESRKEALAELDEAMAQRAADYGVWVVPSEDKLPARAQPMREVNGDKLFVVYDPEEGSRLALEVAYSLARARVLMAKGGAEGLDATALRAEVERATRRDGGRPPDQEQLTGAADGRSRRPARPSARWPTASAAHLAQIDALVAAAADDD